MKSQGLSAWDKAMLGKRFIIETVFDQLKNIAQIDHTDIEAASHLWLI